MSAGMPDLIGQNFNGILGADIKKGDKMTAGTSPSQQKLLKVEVERLKSLADMEIDFSQHPLTAIMGTNCCGKTTVLHALACSFNSPSGGGYKFPQFFKPNTDSLWKGSKFMVHSEQRLGATVQQAVTEFEKARDRWTPRYEKRPTRPVNMLMIRDSVPEVELFGLNSMVHFSKTSLTEAVDIEVRQVAGQVLNKSYDQYHRVTYQYGSRKSIGVSSGGMAYPALSMSSGEQRVFHILQTVFGAPKYALILIDEIDLFLHQDALSRLLVKLNEHCAAKGKQLVFTTHFPPVARMYHDISVKTLHSAAGKTIVWSGYSHAALRGITGVAERPVTVFVEDDVSAAIVERVANELQMRPYVEVGTYGPAANGFSLAVGLFLAGRHLDNTLVVLDGDVMSDKPTRRERIKAMLTGTEPGRDTDRKKVGAIVRALAATKGASGKRQSPEQMLHSFLHSVSAAGLDPEDAALLSLAQEVVNFPDRHGLIDKIVDLTGEDRPVALSKIVKLASRALDWLDYTKVARGWLSVRKVANNL